MVTLDLNYYRKNLSYLNQYIQNSTLLETLPVNIIFEMAICAPRQNCNNGYYNTFKRLACERAGIPEKDFEDWAQLYLEFNKIQEYKQRIYN